MVPDQQTGPPQRRVKLRAAERAKIVRRVMARLGKWDRSDSITPLGSARRLTALAAPVAKARAAVKAKLKGA